MKNKHPWIISAFSVGLVFWGYHSGIADPLFSPSSTHHDVNNNTAKFEAAILAPQTNTASNTDSTSGTPDQQDTTPLVVTTTTLSEPQQGAS